MYVVESDGVERLIGWADDGLARDLVKRQVAAIVRSGHRHVRRLIVGDVDAVPFWESSQRKAVASYMGGGLKTVYREDLNSLGSVKVVAPIFMLKKALKDGRFVIWR